MCIRDRCYRVLDIGELEEFCRQLFIVVLYNKALIKVVTTNFSVFRAIVKYYIDILHWYLGYIRKINLIIYIKSTYIFTATILFYNCNNYIVLLLHSSQNIDY